MKRFFFTFFLLVTLNCQLSTVLAYDPIDTHKADISHPGSDKNNQDYIPVDTNKVPFSTYTRYITISESFPDNPIYSCDKDNHCTIIGYKWQRIDVVHQTVGDFRSWTNYGPHYLNVHFGNPYKDPLDTGAINQAFTSYSLDAPFGASNAARRFLDKKTLTCLIGKRLWDASETLVTPQTNSPRRTDVDVIIHKSSGTRISQVAFALLGTPVFFNPSGPPCSPDSKATLTPGPKIAAALAKKYGTPQPGGSGSTNMRLLYENAIEPINDNALGSLVKQCDLKDGYNEDPNSPCKPKEFRALLQSGGYPGNGSEVLSWILPADSPISNTTFGALTKNVPKKDLLSNPINFKAKYTHQYIYEGEHPGTQSGPTKLVYDIPQNLEAAIRVSETAMRWLIPEKDYLKEKFDSLTGSSTDGLTIDPGYKDSFIRHYVKCQFLPLGWQAIDCNPNQTIGVGATPTPPSDCPPEFNPYSQPPPDNFKDVLKGYCPIIKKYATTGVDPNIIIGIIIGESNYGHPNGFMKANGVTGLMGIISGDCSKDAFGDQYKDFPTAQQLLDPDINIQWGVKSYATFLNYFGGDQYKALFKYCGGEHYQNLYTKTGDPQWKDQLDRCVEYANARINMANTNYQGFCN